MFAYVETKTSSGHSFKWLSVTVGDFPAAEAERTCVILPQGDRCREVQLNACYFCTHGGRLYGPVLRFQLSDLSLSSVGMIIEVSAFCFLVTSQPIRWQDCF